MIPSQINDLNLVLEHLSFFLAHRLCRRSFRVCIRRTARCDDAFLGKESRHVMDWLGSSPLFIFQLYLSTFVTDMQFLKKKKSSDASPGAQKRPQDQTPQPPPQPREPDFRPVVLSIADQEWVHQVCPEHLSGVLTGIANPLSIWTYWAWWGFRRTNRRRISQQLIPAAIISCNW
jgi:hypothetical protein